jgi:hypothetical protein
MSRATQSKPFGSRRFVLFLQLIISRLNRQHRIAVRNCNGRLLHPAIPVESLQVIADAATGTGYVFLLSLLSMIMFEHLLTRI